MMLVQLLLPMLKLMLIKMKNGKMTMKLKEIKALEKWEKKRKISNETFNFLIRCKHTVLHVY